MSSAPMTLEYELSREEKLAAYERYRTRFPMKTPWSRWLWGGFFLYLIYSGWDYQSWWFECLLLLLAIHFCTFPQWFYWAGWLGLKSGLFQADSTTVIIETDERGLRVRRPNYKSGSRFWWSRLTGVDETEFELELRFDGREWGEVMIPWKAFVDEQQRRDFIDLLHEHLPQVSSAAQ